MREGQDTEQQKLIFLWINWFIDKPSGAGKLQKSSDFSYSLQKAEKLRGETHLIRVSVSEPERRTLSDHQDLDLVLFVGPAVL